jgi:hypothetical protein
VGGWESLVSTLLTGVCRSVFTFTDNSSVLNIAFGTHEALQLWQGGALFDITPLGPPTRLAADPLSVTNASATVSVSFPAHGLTTGDTIKVVGAAAVGGVTPNGGPFAVTVDTADTFHFTFTSSATSTATGGGANVVVIPQATLPEGAIDGSGTLGFGSGPYGTGPWGETPETADFFPRTWSFGAWGQELLASPRGGGLYLWSNNTGAAAVCIGEAPARITYALVAPMNGGYQAFALGTQQEADGVFNPMCIRHSAVRDLTTWNTDTSTTAREYVLTGGGRIVAGRMVGPYMLVWTSDALWIGTFVGDLTQPWRFDRIGRNCGLLGPNAAVVVGQTAYWVSPDLQFYSYGVGGAPAPIACPILTDFQTNLAPTQADKVVASSNAMFSEVRFDYPDSRDGYENSRYLALCVAGPDAGSWHRGIMGRSAMVDANPNLYPIGVTDGGAVYYHEKGHSADGDELGWYIETADQLMDPETRMLVRGLWPDFRDQIGPVTVTVKTRETPQGDEAITSASPMSPTDVKADLLTSGRLFRVRFEGQAAPSYVRLGRPIFDVAAAGKL